MTVKDKIREVDKQLNKTTSPYRKRDLEKYKRRLLKGLKKERKQWEEEKKRDFMQ